MTFVLLCYETVLFIYTLINQSNALSCKPVGISIDLSMILIISFVTCSFVVVKTSVSSLCKYCILHLNIQLSAMQMYDFSL